MHHARGVITPFPEHCKHHHRHSGNGLMTQGKVRCGDTRRITAERAVTLLSAFARHPHRFKGCTPQPTRVPDKVYINPPQPEALPDGSSSTETRFMPELRGRKALTRTAGRRHPRRAYQPRQAAGVRQQSEGLAPHSSRSTSVCRPAPTWCRRTTLPRLSVCGTTVPQIDTRMAGRIYF